MEDCHLVLKQIQTYRTSEHFLFNIGFIANLLPGLKKEVDFFVKRSSKT